MLTVWLSWLCVVVSNFYQIFLVMAISMMIHCLLNLRLVTLVLATMDLLWFVLNWIGSFSFKLILCFLSWIGWFCSLSLTWKREFHFCQEGCWDRSCSPSFKVWNFFPHGTQILSLFFLLNLIRHLVHTYDWIVLILIFMEYTYVYLKFVVELCNFLQLEWHIFGILDEDGLKNIGNNC